jgi:hypothetical protein
MRVAIYSFVLFMSMGLLSMGLSAANPGFSSLEERMTGQEFRESGLYKLSDEELAALNRWIRQRSLAEGEAATSQAGSEPAGDRRGFSSSRRSADGPIRSHIVGSFDGWSGEDIFTLENGMVWQQAERRSFTSRPMENPAVEITQGILGNWYLSVEGYNTRVKVNRIK